MNQHHNTERPLNMPRGAYFFAGDDGEPLFQYVSDPSSIIGPRPATEADKKSHPGEWAAFLERRPGEHRLPQLDHDGDGRPGGSLPHEPRPATFLSEERGPEAPKRRGGRPRRQP